MASKEQWVEYTAPELVAFIGSHGLGPLAEDIIEAGGATSVADLVHIDVPKLSEILSFKMVQTSKLARMVAAAAAMTAMPAREDVLPNPAAEMSATVGDEPMPSREEAALGEVIVVCIDRSG
jgi:hypothetical protein